MHRDGHPAQHQTADSTSPNRHRVNIRYLQQREVGDTGVACHTGWLSQVLYFSSGRRIGLHTNDIEGRYDRDVTKVF